MSLPQTYPTPIPNSIYLLARTPEVFQPTAASVSADNSHVTAARNSGPAECRLPFHSWPLRARSNGPDGHCLTALDHSARMDRCTSETSWYWPMPPWAGLVTPSLAFASHHWPAWGTGDIIAFLAQQRDLYAYLHDQTLRLINQGYIHSEIAEMIELPPDLDRAWHTHGCYGSANHNVKAIYQRYLGWYDANPAHLWQHPPEAAGARYVQAFGGVDATVAKAKDFLEQGDLRFAAELASHAVFADPDHDAAPELLATVGHPDQTPAAAVPS